MGSDPGVGAAPAALAPGGENRYNPPLMPNPPEPDQTPQTPLAPQAPPAPLIPGLEDLPKEKVLALPLRSYHGPVVLCETPEQAEAALAGWREPVLGFDIETRPVFKRGDSYPPALVQLAGRDHAVLIRLCKMPPPDALWRLFEDPGVLKVGAGLDRDVKDLQALRPFEPGGFLDLMAPASALGLKSAGLRNLAAVTMGFRIGKGAQTSNWEAQSLSASQVTYAATDAWVGREIYLRLHDLAARHGVDYSAVRRNGAEPRRKRSGEGRSRSGRNRAPDRPELVEDGGGAPQQ